MDIIITHAPPRHIHDAEDQCHRGFESFQHLIDRRHLGLREVPVRQIVGSVGRYHDFDRHFRLKKDRPSERLEHVKEAIRLGQGLPPVELYRIKDEYYFL